MTSLPTRLRRLKRSCAQRAPALIGIGLFCLAWQLIGSYRLAGLTWPPLSVVIGYLVDPDHHRLLTRAASTTLRAVALGYLIGAGIGLFLALAVRLFRPARAGIDTFVALIHVTPAIALAPVFMILMHRDAIPVAICALAVTYLIYVAATSGLDGAKRHHIDLFAVMGARPWQRFWLLERPTALPAIASGLKLAIPVAFMGTIVGEWFGAARGLGLLMVSGMQNFQIPMLWAAVLLTTLTSLVLYALMGLVERAVERRFA
ncbi:ABC transporter permease [Aquimixticola soesokkakensis]|uniref:ABC transporter permease n=1 Tax=Aquimixticola soesokkakensis TaxID=1519096 RepID=UPI001F44B4FF|nr:ABC transporter permease subunit [Aquimixticola soesokkakensis]